MKQINRILDRSEIQKRIESFPVTAILGPRQIGKTTLAHEFGADHFFDLENPRDEARLEQPQLALEDLKGLKIRTQSNPLHLEGFKAFGASPTPMSFAELFTALQQGVVDGQENPIFMTYIVKLYKVQKYLSLTGHLFSPGAFLMSNDFYKGLPKDIRTAIDKAAITAREAAIKEVAETEKAWLPEMAKEIKVNTLSDEQLQAFQKIAKAQWPKMAKIIGEDYFNTIRDKIEEIQSRIGQ